MPSDLEAKYRRYVKNVSYHDWWEYHHYLTWIYYCRIFKVDPRNLEQYYEWVSHGSIHPRFIKKMEKHDMVYKPEWDLQSTPWKDYVEKHPDDSVSSIKHYIWIHGLSRKYDREAFGKWKTIASKDMQRWKDWISWKDFEIKNHREYLMKQHPNCCCIYCGSKGICSCNGVEDEASRQQRWKKLRSKLLR